MISCRRPVAVAATRSLPPVEEVLGLSEVASSGFIARPDLHRGTEMRDRPIELTVLGQEHTQVVMDLERLRIELQRAFVGGGGVAHSAHPLIHASDGTRDPRSLGVIVGGARIRL